MITDYFLKDLGFEPDPTDTSFVRLKLNVDLDDYPAYLSFCVDKDNAGGQIVFTTYDGDISRDESDLCIVSNRNVLESEYDLLILLYALKHKLTDRWLDVLKREGIR